MVNCIHRRNDGEKNLRRANVAGRFVAPNMLLPCLQRQAIGRSAFSIVRDAHEPPGHVTFVLVARGEVCRVGSAKAKRHTKTLRVPNRNICAEFPRWLQYCKRKNIRGNDDERAGIV